MSAGKKRRRRATRRTKPKRNAPKHQDVAAEKLRAVVAAKVAEVHERFDLRDAVERSIQEDIEDGVHAVVRHPVTASNAHSKLAVLQSTLAVVDTQLAKTSDKPSERL